jgi:hypothetical protein
MAVKLLRSRLRRRIAVVIQLDFLQLVLAELMHFGSNIK